MKYVLSGSSISVIWTPEETEMSPLCKSSNIMPQAEPALKDKGGEEECGDITAG